MASPPPLSRALFLATVACGFGLGLPILLDVTGDFRCLFSAALLFVLGAAITRAPLGLVFPALVQATTSKSGGNASWLFALNACASVAGSALNAILGPRLGLDGAATVALLIYGALFVLALLRSPSPTTTISPQRQQEKPSTP
ncbi:MAG: hypothetical protein GY822_21050 [Deltaproteobacteria bacterium]|nr:hypothetical protein [Deltaproteobacteria bacterium]